MQHDLDSIIKRLEQVQELIYQGKYEDAKTSAYYAQSTAQSLKDSITRCKP